MSGPFGSSQWMYASGGFYGYEIGQSARFNYGDSAYLSRTPASNGNRKTWTFSTWVKRGNLNTNYSFWGATSGSNEHVLRFNDGTGDELAFWEWSGSYAFNLKTNAKFRDVAGWYHIVIACDTTQATASDRLKMYVNGEQVTSFSTATYPSQNYDTYVNSTSNPNYVGWSGYSNNYYDGYMAETILVDGTALDPTSFGETKSGIWIPKAYSGSYGTNGFHLEFAGNANDTSGNGNNFTATNISAYDYVPDSPTNNFGTFSALMHRAGSAPVLSQGNLTAVWPGYWFGSTVGITSGKWYWEYVITAGTVGSEIGIATANRNFSGGLSNSSVGTGYGYITNGQKFTNTTYSAYGASWTTGDIIGIAFDYDSGTLTFYKNNSSQGTAFTGIGADTWIPAFGNNTGSSMTARVNFGQDSSFAGTKTAQGNTDANGVGDFYYSPPSGFLALCSANLPAPAIDPAEDASPTDYFNTVLYSGNGSTNAITGVGFGPEFCWAKSRNLANSHRLIDIVRGDSILYSDLTDAENTGGDFTFDSDGITWNGGGANANDSDKTFVLWSWLAGGTAASNTDGSITSTVSANTDSGFSIVTWTGNGVTGATIGHGLGAKPDWILLKKRSATSSWIVYNSARGATKYITLPGTPSEQTSSGAWNDTEPTTSVFTTGSFGDVKDSGATFVAYCFAKKDGYAAQGTYVGNGSSDGPFVYTGFRPAVIIAKNINDATTNWWLHDNERLGYNDKNYALFPALNYAEDANVRLDILSNGFKIRNTAKHWNTSGQTFIYLAIAEQPFKYANAR
jgi:hypothetical protein